jgi:hypothetical protein
MYFSIRNLDAPRDARDGSWDRGSRLVHRGNRRIIGRGSEPMIYLKATAVGIISAVLLAVAWFWAALQLPVWWQMWQQRNQGAGVGASFVGSGSVLLAALVGFVLGFFWMVRRGSN